MNKKTNLPRFTCSHNPLVNNEVYVIIHHKERVTIRVSDWQAVEGEATEQLISRAKDWYISYQRFINS
jgi:hypothetical protein